MLEQRKADHLRIGLEEDIAFPKVTTGLESYSFVHRALPELARHEIDMSCRFLGKHLRLPLLISSMTGGTADAKQINLRLAAAAESAGVALGLGSYRAALERPHLASTYEVRDAAPSILLLANLGAAQLNTGLEPDDCRRTLESTGADALILHLNPLQEALQEDGDTDWRGLLGKIERVCRTLEAPVIAKEVGWGISAEVARRLADVGVAGIDVAGAGGTSWSQVEMHRARGRRVRQCAEFEDWGIRTADALLEVRAALPTIPLIASGGLRSAMDVAKSIALGADLGGLAQPFLKAAAVSAQAVLDLILDMAEVLQTAMFCLGIRDLTALKGTPALRLRAEGPCR